LDLGIRIRIDENGLSRHGYIPSVEKNGTWPLLAGLLTPPEGTALRTVLDGSVPAGYQC
jgi:hypothetical protein